MRAAITAGVLSGIPSTLHALITGKNPLRAVYAAGTLIIPEKDDPRRLLIAGLATHAAISTWWTTVLAATLPQRHSAAWGAAAGIGIAALDLGVVGRRYPAIRALGWPAQIADHLAFGALAGWSIEHHRSNRG